MYYMSVELRNKYLFIIIIIMIMAEMIRLSQGLVLKNVK